MLGLYSVLLIVGNPPPWALKHRGRTYLGLFGAPGPDRDLKRLDLLFSCWNRTAWRLNGFNRPCGSRAMIAISSQGIVDGCTVGSSECWPGNKKQISVPSQSQDFRKSADFMSAKMRRPFLGSLRLGLLGRTSESLNLPEPSKEVPFVAFVLAF